MFDNEKFSIVGKYGIELTENKKFTSSELIPDEVKNKIIAERDLWIAHLQFLQKGNEVQSKYTILSNLSLATVDTDSESRPTVEDDFLYQTFYLDWNRMNMQSFPNGADLKSVSGPQGYTGYFAYDRTIKSAEREDTVINVFIVEWDKRRVYKLQSDMQSASGECKDILKYVEVFGSLEMAIEWSKAKDCYEVATKERFKDLFAF